MRAARTVFWLSAGGLAWTHVGYPLAAATLARLRPRPVRKEDLTPDVTVVVAAHDEQDVIGSKIENVAALDRLDFTEDELAEIDRYATDAGINIWASSSES